MATTVNRILSNPRQRRAVEAKLAARGVKGDTLLAHINPREVGILRQAGGVGTRNPKTGLLQFHDAAQANGEGHGSGDGADGQGGNGGGGGYGNASDGHSSEGSGAGAGGGHTGNNYTSQQFGNNPTGPIAPPPPPPPPPPGVGLPSAVPIPTTALMSQNPGNLVGGAFGALPSWATQSYQIGTAPASYPVPGQTVPGQPPVTPPPVAPGLGGAGGGVAPGLGGNSGGGGFNNGGGNPNGGGQQGTGLHTTPGMDPNLANFIDTLHAHGIGLGNNPITHQTPGFANVVDGGGVGSGPATGILKQFGITPKPQAPTPTPTPAPVQQGGGARFLQAAGVQPGGIFNTPVQQPKPVAKPAPTLLGGKKVVKKAVSPILSYSNR